MQFFLVYLANFSWYDVDTMPIQELHYFYDLLVEQKDKEANPEKEEVKNIYAAS